ncbi:winged helix-turn-helix domain-containing protein [Natronococcus wangiae]|uniref:winged helix-turn-helix domain-containing protein n=1 Tax=Natronococcus wangiae TaxID=3068275 RepID=UPI00273EB32F|nr:winged helix-turn-helix transcriptional regulator [Natronococcus sp. AD5]
MEDIASEVTGASTDLVEKVLEEYGDPATDVPSSEDQIETESDGRNGPSQTENGELTDELTEPVNETRLSEKQRETLRTIVENPDATQREIAARFDVTAATISRRINSIEGFEWSKRGELAERLLDSEKGEPMKQEQSAQSTTEVTDRIDELTRHIQRLETRLDETATRTKSGIEDPELMVKIMHACLESDRITEDEEVMILDEFLTGDRNQTE